MKEKINIATILKDKPQGTKLYSRICGAVELKKVIDVRKKKSIVVKELNSNNKHRFWYDGNFFRAGQCVLQPSENMADWSKFSWKKGDVLVSNDGKCKVIFERFDDDTYTSFVGKYYVECYGKNNELQDYEEEHYGDTVNYTKESEEAAQTYINTIEERLGGKLNIETLEIEKIQPEFKDGDILSCDEDSYTRHTTLILHKDENITESIVSLVRHKKLIRINVPIDNFLLSRLYPAREDEKKELFDALAKSGKAWDAEKKQIVDIKNEHQFKPFEKVLVRDSYDDMWRASFFSHIKEDDGRYVTTCLTWRFCVPYEGNEHLLGTTNNVEG